MLLQGLSRLLVLLSVLHASEQQKYAVIFDGGSTGSRVHVFSFGNDMSLLPIGQDYEFYFAINPGLSSYANDPNAAAESLRPLLQQAEAVIPQDLLSTTPLKLGATAGLRLLPGDASDAILEAVRELFHTESNLDYRPEWVTLLEGTDEGAYMWIAINYLLGSLGELGETVSVIDLGGGSVQMAYAISEDAASNAPPLSPQGEPYVTDRLVLGTNYHLYTHSYLNYGMQAARAQNLKLSGSYGNPCVTNGFQGTFDYNGESLKAAPPSSGTNFRRCRALTRKMLNLDAPCSHANCTFNAIWNGGGGDGYNNLHVASYFYDMVAESGIVAADANTARIRPIMYKKEAKRACSANVNIDNIKSIYPEIEEWDLGYMCMSLVYEYTLLVDGFGIHPSKEITVIKNLNYKGSWIGAAWPLGAAVELLSLK